MIYDDITEAVIRSAEVFCQVEELHGEFASLFINDEDFTCIVDHEPLPKPPKVIHMKNFIFDRRQKIHRCRNNC